MLSVTHHPSAHLLLQICSHICAHISNYEHFLGGKKGSRCSSRSLHPIIADVGNGVPHAFALECVAFHKGVEGNVQMGIFHNQYLNSFIAAWSGARNSRDYVRNLRFEHVPLQCSPATQAYKRIRIHRGTCEAATSNLPLIENALRPYIRPDKDAGTATPGQPACPAETSLCPRSSRDTASLWLTGHSLGGGVAQSLLLHLLGSQHPLVGTLQQGGCITFGASMAVHYPIRCKQRERGTTSELVEVERGQLERQIGSQSWLGPVSHHQNLHTQSKLPVDQPANIAYKSLRQALPVPSGGPFALWSGALPQQPTPPRSSMALLADDDNNDGQRLVAQMVEDLGGHAITVLDIVNAQDIVPAMLNGVFSSRTLRRLMRLAGGLKVPSPVDNVEVCQDLQKLRCPCVSMGDRGPISVKGPHKGRILESGHPGLHGDNTVYDISSPYVAQDGPYPLRQLDRPPRCDGQGPVEVPEGLYGPVGHLLVFDLQSGQVHSASEEERLTWVRWSWTTMKRMMVQPRRCFTEHHMAGTYTRGVDLLVKKLVLEQPNGHRCDSVSGGYFRKRSCPQVVSG